MQHPNNPQNSTCGIIMIIFFSTAPCHGTSVFINSSIIIVPTTTTHHNHCRTRVVLDLPMILLLRVVEQDLVHEKVVEIPVVVLVIQ
jgi:hypothetical protein